MIIALLGASGSGKTTIQNALVRHGFEKIVSHTTREPRINEVSGQDYYFTSNTTFEIMVESGLFAEFDEYSQNRKYGTLLADYDCEVNKIVVLTPNGLRQIKSKFPNEKIFTVLIKANLGTRVKRYIDRCEVDKFNFDDMNEIFARVNRDFGMFLGLDREVDMIVHNNEGTDVNDLVKEIIRNAKKKYK